MNRIVTGMVLVGVSLSVQVVEARSWFVLLDGSGDAPTIQAAIDSSESGDEVVVGPGTYYENVSFDGKSIVLQSQSGSSVTTIDGSVSPNPVVRFQSAETRDAIITGFTLRGGTGDTGGNPAGGGIYISGGASPTILNNQIVNNTLAQGDPLGAGIAVIALGASESSPLICGNLFKQNYSEGLGGGVAFNGSGSPEICHNVFEENTSQKDGGALFILHSDGSPTIRYNQFFRNFAADHGGAIAAADVFAGGSISISRNLIVENRALGAGGGNTGAGSGIYCSQFEGVISNNTIADNVASGEAPANGALMLFNPGGISVHHNIIANNSEERPIHASVGIACFNASAVDMGTNLLWGHDLPIDAGGTRPCPQSWLDVLILADPEFCDPESDNYTVGVDSPALSGPNLMGVWTSPGCGPGVPVEFSTWGRLKLRFRDR